MPASRTVLLGTTAVNSLLYSTKRLLVLLATCAIMSTTVSLANSQKCTAAGDRWNGLCTQNNNSLDQNCVINLDCATSKVCCSNKCIDGFNCLGEDCTVDDDCHWDDESCCLGSCRKLNACTNLAVMIVIYISASLLLIAVICPLVFRKLTSTIQPLSSPRHADIQQEAPSHPTLPTFFARGSNNLSISSVTTNKESRDVNITITSYGSIRMPNQP